MKTTTLINKIKRWKATLNRKQSFDDIDYIISEMEYTLNKFKREQKNKS